MSKDQVLNSEILAPPEKPKDQEEIPGYTKNSRPLIVVTANGLIVKSNLNPNALEFYPTWILNKVDKVKDNVKEKISTETLEEIKKPCHCEIIQEIVNKNDSLFAIIEQPEKGLKTVKNFVVEEIIERKLSKDSLVAITEQPEKGLKTVTNVEEVIERKFSQDSLVAIIEQPKKGLKTVVDEIIEKTISKDSLVAIIEQPEKGLKTVTNVEEIIEIKFSQDSLAAIIKHPEKGLKTATHVEEVVEKNFSKDFEKTLNQEKENYEGKIGSLKCEMLTKCEGNKEELNSNGETTLKSKEVLVKCREHESACKKIQIAANIDPQVLFFGPATVKHTESSTDLNLEISKIEICTNIETAEEIKDLKNYDGKYSDTAIIENTVVGDHTEANVDLQLNKACDDAMPTSTTKLKDKILTSDENNLKYTSKIATSGTIKGLSRTTTGNKKSTGTVKKLLNTISPEKETKVMMLSASKARSCLTTPRKVHSTLEAKKNEAPSANLTKRTNLQLKGSVIASNVFIKKDILAKSKTKDSISTRSTCSTDKSSLSNKSSSSPSSKAKVLSSKAVEKSLPKLPARPIEKPGLKKMDYLTRSPGGTVSSNLRKTETQKRQNLFPDSDAIKMTESLFK